MAIVCFYCECDRVSIQSGMIYMCRGCFQKRTVGLGDSGGAKIGRNDSK